MNWKTKLIVGASVCAVAAVTVWAGTALRTFRTDASIVALVQGTNDLTGNPQYEFAHLAGHDLVNLALGTDLSTKRTNEVLALQVDCASSLADLVVFDIAAGSNIASIATSSSLDVVVQQDRRAAPGPNRERFIAQMDIQAGGSASNALLGGTLTVAGRLSLDPTNGCPRSVLIGVDRDPSDRKAGDADFKDQTDHERYIQRAGLGHAIGVIDVVTDGNTNRVLVPNMQLSIRRRLQ